MRAATFAGRREVRVISVPEPVIEAPGDAIVEVSLTAICGSDLHVYHERETGIDTGTTLGHEFVGRVVELGPAVSSFTPGARVVSPFTTSCGSCFYCARGLTCRCTHGQLFGWVQQGSGLQGAQAERVRVPLAESTLVPLADEVPDEVGILLGDVLPTGWYAAELAGVEAGGAYAVVGCGPVGLTAILACRTRGAVRVLAIDPVAERLAIARRLGATAVEATADEALHTMREWTDGRGADAVLEVVGSPAATRLAVDLVRPGGIVGSVGVHTDRQFPFTPVEAYDKNLTYRSGRCPARRLMTELAPAAPDLVGPLTSIVSHRLSLSEAPEGYALFDARADGCTKVVLVP